MVLSCSLKKLVIQSMEKNHSHGHPVHGKKSADFQKDTDTFFTKVSRYIYRYFFTNASRYRN